MTNFNPEIASPAEKTTAPDTPASCYIGNHKKAKADVRDVAAEHRDIMQAVLDRDVSRATTLMDRHLSATETSVVRLLAARPLGRKRV